MNTFAFPKTDASSGVGHNTLKATIVVKLKAFLTNAVAKLLLVVAVGSLAWLSWRPNLYELYQIDHRFIVAKLAEEPALEFKQAATYFKQGNYDAAAQLVSKLYLNNKNKLSLAKKYAMVLIANDNLEIAKKVLYPIYASNDGNSKAEAAYLLSLIFLKEEKNAESKSWLVKVPKNTIYYNQSQEILAKLENLTVRQ
ncbi:hypothetical protein [Pedobacter sp. SL55]|uniref:hypothetical protein n=1 Tax=Pedobacter sp. SL55 TaxID=2995161 RepID=UPI00226EE773|nr:hypothetical protein [Pedobacter sp. SL55]WAC40831.1 hypothetical protein OVA16_00135 [Pedobacter sp. SL55]